MNQSAGCSGRKSQGWSRSGRASALVGVVLLLFVYGCAATNVATAEEAPATPLLSAEATSSGDHDAIVADLEELERGRTEGLADAADKQIHEFRRARLLADLVERISAGDESYFAYLALGRVLAISAGEQPGADRLAVYMLSQAERLDDTQGEAPYRRGALLIGMGQPDEALVALEHAQHASTLDEFPELPYQRALALTLRGKRREAVDSLTPYLEEHPTDSRAQRLMERLSEGQGAPDPGSTIRIGLEGESLVRYEVKGATWRITHETLGFSISLPVSWQMTGEETLDGEGFVQLVAPPVSGADRLWRTDLLTVWGVALPADEGIDWVKSAYVEGIEDLSDVETIETESEDTVFVRLRRSPFFEASVVGLAMLVRSGEMGYVVEFWGDPVSFAQSEGQAVEIMRTFRTLHGEV